jgi:hypothetical protein
LPRWRCALWTSYRGQEMMDSSFEMSDTSPLACCPGSYPSQTLTSPRHRGPDARGATQRICARLHSVPVCLMLSWVHIQKVHLRVELLPPLICSETFFFGDHVPESSGWLLSGYGIQDFPRTFRLQKKNKFVPREKMDICGPDQRASIDQKTGG